MQWSWSTFLFSHDGSYYQKTSNTTAHAPPIVDNRRLIVQEANPYG
jgi:hypothetical protein